MRKSWIAFAAVAAAMLPSCTLLPSAPPANDYIGPAKPSPSQAGQLGEAAAPAAPPQAAPQGPLAVSLNEAILLAMEHNRDLSVRRLDPSISRTFEQEERAAFDPDVSIEASHLRQRAPLTDDTDLRSTDTEISTAVAQHLPTGTDVSVGLTGSVLTSQLSDDQHTTRIGLSVNQALLRGAGLGVNLAAVGQARIDTLVSEYELRGFAESLVAQTEQTYWQYAFAERTIEIVTDALKLAQQQLDETRERVKVGTLAETELAAPEAEVASRRENLINARALLGTKRLQLLRLMNPRETDFQDRQVLLSDAPGAPDVNLDDAKVYVEVAMRMRPDLNQARLGVQRGDLELVQTRNGLLPRLDLFVNLGKSGYAESFCDSIANIGQERHYDAEVGLVFEFPPANRAAKARHERAGYSRDRAMLAVENLAQLVEVDVRIAYGDVNRAREQVTATAATRHFKEESLRAETEKFRVGKSTSFLVGQAQRDLLQSQIDEVGSLVDFLNSLANLHLQEGALLERRGIVAPGATPVDTSAPPRW